MAANESLRAKSSTIGFISGVVRDRVFVQMQEKSAAMTQYAQGCFCDERAKDEPMNFYRIGVP
jgi:hypothetical protein